ncbi:MAG: TonB-dependent receptor [Ignavibacteria bacterium]|jgi:TonB-dependent receptor
MKHGVTIKKSIVVFLLLIPSVLFGSGKVNGTVVDSLSQESLVGANVFLVGTSLGGAVDIEGNYEIHAIPPGEYTVKCTYIGYVAKETRVTVVDNQTTVLDFQLAVDVIEGSEVVVYGQALGQAAAINQQVTSNAIVNVVSEQKIKELPDANAAEALGRLPGVSIVRSGGEASKIILRGLDANMTTVTVDGVKLSPTEADSRGIDLSTIAQGALSGIVLSKAVTSDMEGEAIAGNVDFVTKNAPEKRELNINAYGSYGSLDETAKQYNFTGGYGERFFNGLLGVQLFGNIERRNRSSEEYSIDYDQTIDERQDYQIDDFNVRYTNEIRRRGGGRLLLDYKLPNDGMIKFSGQYNRTERRYSTYSRNYPIVGEVNYDFEGEDINTDIASFSLQGANNISDWEITWNMSYSESSSEKPYGYSAGFDEPSLSEGGQAIAGMRWIPPEYRKTTSYEILVPYALNNFDVAYFNGATASTSDNLDFEKTIFFNAKKTYDLFGMMGEFKFGGKYRSKYHRRTNRSSNGVYYNGSGFYDYLQLPDGTVVPKDFERYGFTDLQISTGNLILLTNFLDSDTRDIYDKYLLYPLTDADRFRAWYDMNKYGYDPNSGLVEHRPSSSTNGSNYNLTENVASTYIMNTLNIGQLFTLIAGVRIEADDNTYNAHYADVPVTEWTTFKDTSATHTETIVLPNLHLIVKPTDFLNVRFAAYRGIKRPGFNRRLPTYYYGSGSVTLNNTNLKNSDAWNFETNIQIFNNTIGLFSVSAFYKRISNEVHYLDETPVFDKETTDSLGIVFPNDTPPITGRRYSVSYPYNSDKVTQVWGFEVEQQTNFRYLPGLLSNIVLSYNLSFIKSETYTPAEEYIEYYVQLPGSPFPTKRTRIRLYEALTRIENSPEFFCNVSVGYDIGGFSGRVSYFYQGEFYNGYSAEGYSNNIQKSFGRVDLSLKQNLTENLSVGLNVNNITNAEEGTFLENTTRGWKLKTRGYHYGTTGDLWLRVSI